MYALFISLLLAASLPSLSFGFFLTIFSLLPFTNSRYQNFSSLIFFCHSLFISFRFHTYWLILSLTHILMRDIRCFFNYCHTPQVANTTAIPSHSPFRPPKRKMDRGFGTYDYYCVFIQPLEITPEKIYMR